MYGTLQPLAGSAMSAWLAARSTDVEPAVIRGRLNAIPDREGWFPALTPGQGAVKGMVCHLRLRPGDLALLDRYEGRTYRRRSVRARTVTGRCLPVQTYGWCARQSTGVRPIRNGDFLHWRRAHRAKAFGVGHAGKRMVGT